MFLLNNDFHFFIISNQRGFGVLGFWGLTDEHVKMWGWNISKSEEHISEKIIDTDSAEYIFLKNNGFIIEESEI